MVAYAHRSSPEMSPQCCVHNVYFLSHRQLWIIDAMISPQYVNAPVSYKCRGQSSNRTTPSGSVESRNTSAALTASARTVVAEASPVISLLQIKDMTGCRMNIVNLVAGCEERVVIVSSPDDSEVERNSAEVGISCWMT